MHPLKTITSGEGGIITTNNKKIAKNIKLYRSHGILRNKKQYWKYDILKMVLIIDYQILIVL
jgi:dTDP-4-amino-4,6-dideoxygalactose transaminase